MPCFDTNHKQQSANCLQPVDDAVAREIEPRSPPHEGDAGEMHSNQNARQASFQTSEQGGGMHTPSNCAAIFWALEQDVSTASSSRLLIEIARRSTGGRCASTQVDLGRACKLSERQTRTLIASLIADGAVKRHRQGGTGDGRAPDQYELVGYAEQQPAETAACAEATGTDEQVGATGNQQELPKAHLATGSFNRKELPVGATGNGAPAPPIRTTSSVEDNLQAPEPSFDRGLGGELFTDAPPAPPPKAKKSKGTPRRPRQEKFYATEDSMPAEPNPAMSEYAASKHLINGTRGIEFGKFRRFHIRNRSLIKSLEQRWETWVDNWSERNPKRPDGAPAGYKLAGFGDDGKARYVKDHRTNVYR